MFKNISKCALALSFSFFAGATTATAAVIDFDASVNNGGSVVESGATVTPDSGLLSFATAPGGSRALVSSGTDPDYWIASFVTNQTSVSVDLGDYNADSDTLFIEAYNGSNVVVDMMEQFIASTFRGMMTLSVSAADISYVHFGVRGGGVFADNLTFTGDTVPAVPVPASMPLVLAGVAAFGLIGRRAKKRS